MYVELERTRLAAELTGDSRDIPFELAKSELFRQLSQLDHQRCAEEYNILFGRLAPKYLSIRVISNLDLCDITKRAYSKANVSSLNTCHIARPVSPHGLVRTDPPLRPVPLLII